jgi:hypothetical protein
MGKRLREVISETLGQEISYEVGANLSKILVELDIRLLEHRSVIDEYDIRNVSYSCVNVPEEQREFAEMLVKAGILYHGKPPLSHLYGITKKGRACLFDTYVQRAHAKKFHREWGPIHGYPLPPEEKYPALTKFATEMAKQINNVRVGDRRGERRK